MLYQMKPLSGIHILSLAVNLPGPLALARLCQLGATAVKVEPPNGDPLAQACPDWYATLIEGIQAITLDLKTTPGREQLDRYLSQSDLLLTSSRPAAMKRLGLSWGELSERFPHLLQVAIVGQKPPDENRPGHDLSYQAIYGLVDPPNMPRSLLADLAGAEQAISAALALLLGRERGTNIGKGEDSNESESQGRLAFVSLSEAAASFAQPLKHGLTRPGGLLGGSLPGYNLYQAKDGWVAVAALEQHFLMNLASSFGLGDLDQAKLARIFLTRPALEWEAWAAERDLPIVAVRRDP
jgi:crotonobetainyl-CoA:carnitine CoA-transferase CaiB-like acyl-CoA transferase